MLKYVVIGISVIVFGFECFQYGKKSIPDPKKSEDTQTQKDSQTDTKTHDVIITIEKPDGSKQITETKDTTSEHKSDTKQTVDTVFQPIPKSKAVNVSVLIGEQTPHLFNTPTYGISVTKPVLGGFTVGAFGMTNGMLGVSLGMDF